MPDISQKNICTISRAFDIFFKHISSTAPNKLDIFTNFCYQLPYHL